MFAVKLQAIQGKPDDKLGYDYRGSEPTDTHRTLAEKDPIDDSEIERWERLVEVANEAIEDLIPANDFGHIELRIMDSDGRR